MLHTAYIYIRILFCPPDLKRHRSRNLATCDPAIGITRRQFIPKCQIIGNDARITISSRGQATSWRNTDRHHPEPSRKGTTKDRSLDRRRYSRKVWTITTMITHQSHLTHRLANVFETVGPENTPQSHANPLVTQLTAINPGATPLPREDENDEEDQAYFKGTFRKIAPPDWEFHQVTEHNGDVTSHWTYTNERDTTTYPPETDFVARYPSYLKLWHVCLYQWYQINRTTEEEIHICDFYVNNATQLCHYENPMHQHIKVLG